MSFRRHGLGVTAVVTVLAGFAACAEAEGDAAMPELDFDAGMADSPIPTPTDDVEGGSSDEDAGARSDSSTEVEAGLPACTVDWCDTALPIPDGGSLRLMDVWVGSSTNVWSVSAEGKVLHWDGTTWSVVWSTDKTLYGVWGDQDGTIWVVGAAGTIFRGPNGANFTAVPNGGVTLDVVGICEGPRDAEHARSLAIVGAGNRVLQWNGTTAENGDPVWDVSTFAPTSGREAAFHAITCVGHDVWISGMWNEPSDTGGRIFVRYDGEPSWTRIRPMPTDLGAANEGAYWAIWAAGPEHVWVRGSQNIIYATPNTDGGAPLWRSETSATGLTTTTDRRRAAAWGSNPSDVWIASNSGRIHHWNGSKLSITATAKTWDVLSSNLHGVHGSGPNEGWVVGDNVALRRNQDAGTK